MRLVCADVRAGGANAIAGGVSAGRQMYIYIPNCGFRRIGVYLITDNGRCRDEPNAIAYYAKKEKNKNIEISTFLRCIKSSI